MSSDVDECLQEATCLPEDTGMETECQINSNRCSIHAECINTIGSYECECRPGYQGNGINCTGNLSG